MSTLSTLLVIGGCFLLIGVGVVSLIHDLLGRGPHEAPLMDEESSPRPHYQGSDSPADPSAANLRVGIGRCGGVRR